MSPLITIVRDLLRAVAWREGLITRVVAEFGPASGASDGMRRKFHDSVHCAIEELRAEFGPTADPEAARAFGLDPETILGDPTLEDAPSMIAAFAVWRSQDLWLFIAARFCGAPDVSHYVIVVGAASQNASVAMSRTA